MAERRDEIREFVNNAVEIVKFNALARALAGELLLRTRIALAHQLHVPDSLPLHILPKEEVDEVLKWREETARLIRKIDKTLYAVTGAHLFPPTLN